MDNYYEIIKRIETRRRNGKQINGLKKALELIDSPQEKLKCIHIGGTNGKGSTCNNIKNILVNSGYKVGIFTSPHLINHEERIKINDSCILKKDIVNYYNKYHNMWDEYELSMFEIDFFISADYFYRNKCDFVIYEVGMGGEKDATNIITPIISAITNVGYDHQKYLGDTIEEIAKTKAGIIKKNIPIVTGANGIALEIIERVANIKNSEVVKLGRYNIEKYAPLTINYDHLKFIQNDSPIYQTKNILLAYEIIKKMNQLKYCDIQNENIVKSIKINDWKGRYQIINDSPKIIVDGAHNIDGISELCRNIELEKNPVVLFAVSEDKDYQDMCNLLKKSCDNIYACEYSNERSLKAINLVKQCNLKYCDDYKSFIDNFINNNIGQTLIICGSLYFVGEVLEYIEKNHKN